MSRENESDSGFNAVSFVFIILLIIFNWGALGWLDILVLFLERNDLLRENILYTLPLNLSLAFALIIMTSVKRYKNFHFYLSALFFVLITGLFNRQGWLNPPIEINQTSSLLFLKLWKLLKSYFEHYGLFNFMSSILIALYFTYYWHFVILGKKEEDFD